MAAVRACVSSFGRLFAATTRSYAAVSASIASVSCRRSPTSTAAAACSAARFSSDPDRVFRLPDTMIRSDAPTAQASAEADPPPGVGSDELNASSRSVNGRSTSMGHASFFHDGANRVRADTNEIDGRTIDDDRVQLLAGFEAAHAIVPVERIRAVDRRADQSFFERQAHAEA